MKDAALTERVGPRYRPEAMRAAQALTMRAVHRLGERLVPGMRESAARALADTVLRELGYERRWHPNIVRFGENTCRMWKEPSVGDPVLGDNDIAFVDLGAVFDGCEGDAGATFVVGDDDEMHACAAAARELWDLVAAVWREQRVSGRALYRFAEQEATRRGWVFNHAVKGHRISDFPHAVFKAPDLGAIGHPPGEALWILEIQIAHPSRPFGAFHEDMLLG